MLWLIALALASPLSDRLTAQHERLLANPTAYAASVKAQAHVFPEGSLFPWTFSVHAYTNLAMAEDSQRAHALTRIEAVMPHAIRAVEDRLGAKILALDDVGRQATWAGQLQLALACYHRLGGTKWKAERAHLDAQFAAALDARQGKPLDSFPGLLWPFDTIPVVLGLRMADLADGTDLHTARIRRHLDWLTQKGLTDRGQPVSRLHPTSFAHSEGPRGCDLSWRLALLAQLDPALSRSLYTTYLRDFWHMPVMFQGFREWPAGVAQRPDADSGPVLFELGSAATALGLGAARAHNDSARATLLADQADKAIRMLPQLRALVSGASAFPHDADFLTGAPMGDAVLFWASTWWDWNADLPASGTR